jgi:DNA-binding LytR/AlgR family response regulator
MRLWHAGHAPKLYAAHASGRAYDVVDVPLDDGHGLQSPRFGLAPEAHRDGDNADPTRGAPFMNERRAVLAEDEPVLLAQLRDMLANVWPELAIVGEAEDGFQALRLLEQCAPDVLFLDIQMPGMTGLEVAKQASGRCHVVFVTAYDKYAVAAFEEGAVDYVMKPFTAARLATAVGRVKAKMATAPARLDGILKTLADAASRKDYLRWITATQGDDLRLITVDEIAYIKADNKYTIVVTQDRESLIRRPIRELVDELDPDVFWQIHRGTLVNVNAIAGVTRDIAGKLRVKLKNRSETLSVSDPYLHLFRSM